MLSVHFHAFRLNTKAYLTAAKWWLLGKRVRARGQFALLLSQTPNAYMLWMLKHEQQALARPGGEQVPPLVGLVIGDDSDYALKATLESLAGENIQAFVVRENCADDIQAAVDSIAWDQGPWLLLISAGDRLVQGAAAIYRAAMRQTDSRVVYADDDLVNRWHFYSAPHFKPDWNSELFQYHDYLTGSCAIKIEASDLLDAASRADWAPYLVSKAVAGRVPFHVRQVLHHRAFRPALPVNLPSPTVSGNLPFVSVIVPTRNRLNLLRTCLEGLERTDYPDMEVLVVDNDSDDPDTLEYLASISDRRFRVLHHAGAFNYSTINNRAVAEAKGRLICLLNNDIEIVNEDWLAILASQAIRDEVGAVGAQLLYPDGRIQHAGVVIGVGNAAGHAHRFVRPEAEGYFHRHALPQFVSAVTAACLVVDRSRFLAVGGLDERNFAVAFNDVDLCLRLNQRGWQSLYEPRVVLIHHESASRGHDRDPTGAARFAGELAALQRIWHTESVVDPYHHPSLSRASEQFCPAL